MKYSFCKPNEALSIEDECPQWVAQSAGAVDMSKKKKKNYIIRSFSQFITLVLPPTYSH
jgi:hypothetical protein